LIADRPYLADQFKELKLNLSELDDWIDNPARPFPGDSVAIADQLQWLATLLRAEDETPKRQTR
jgi:hypothetical protein